MPLVGIEKDRHSWVNYRFQQQKEFWPDVVKQLDEKSKGVRFRAEVLSYSDLFNIYINGVENILTDEEESRGKKKKRIDKVSEVIPAKAFALPGRYNERCLELEYGHDAKDDDGLGIPQGWGYLNYDQWLYARDQARKELFWLCKEVFDLDVQPHVHQVVCDQFVVKIFDGVFRQGYSTRRFQEAMSNQTRVPHQWASTQEYITDTKKRFAKVLQDLAIGDFGKYISDPIEAERFTNFARTMQLMDPRGFFKSTIDMVDCVQWILNCPDIRILILSGVKELAELFLAGVKQRPAERKKMSFYLPSGVPADPLHLLFPEYVIRGIAGTSQEPLRIAEDASPYLRGHGGIHPTLGIIAVGASMSGFRCDVLKFDDAVTDQNSLNEETRQKVKIKADGSINLLMPWGWHDIIGTRYFPEDYYGATLKSNEEDPEAFNLKFFQRACWTVKKEFKHVEEQSLLDLTEEMVDLTFPELAGSAHKSFLNLRGKLKKEPLLFRCQQLNQPVWGDSASIKFDRALLNAACDKTLSEIEALKGEDVYVFGAIDPAKENKQFSDNTAIAVCKIYQEGKTKFDPMIESFDEYLRKTSNGKWIMVVLDCQFGKWSQTEIANRIADMNNRWHPQNWRGEDFGGAETFKEKIVNVSLEKYGIWPNITWLPPKNSEGAKKNRVKGLELLLRSGRLYFLIDSKWNNDVFNELEKYVGQKSTRYFKDDVPDVLAQLTERIPRFIHLSKQEIEMQERAKEELHNKQIRQAIYDATFGSRGGFGMSESFSYGESSPDEPRVKGPVSDIGRRFFGGNGMRA